MWPFNRKTQDRALWNVGGELTGPVTAAGVRVTTDSAQRQSAVWACVRILTDTVSCLPVHAFAAGSRDPVDPAPTLLRTPASATPLHDWLHQVMRSLLLAGNAWGIVTMRAGDAFRPTQIELIAPRRITVQTGTERGTIYRLDGREIDRDELWHLRAYPSPGDVLGLSPIAYAAQTIGVGLAAEKFGGTFFGDGAVPSGVISVEKHITEGQAKDTAKLWNTMFSNVAGKRRVAVIGDGGRFNPVSIRPDESQFLETQKATIQAVARIFGIPPEMIASHAGDSLTYANTEQRAIDFLTFTINPWLVRLETALTELLPRGQVCKFNSGALLRSALKDRYESYEIALRNNFMTVDQVRELEDWEPLPAGAARPALEAAA